MSHSYRALVILMASAVSNLTLAAPAPDAAATAADAAPAPPVAAKPAASSCDNVPTSTSQTLKQFGVSGSGDSQLATREIAKTVFPILLGSDSTFSFTDPAGGLYPHQGVGIHLTAAAPIQKVLLLCSVENDGYTVKYSPRLYSIEYRPRKSNVCPPWTMGWSGDIVVFDGSNVIQSEERNSPPELAPGAGGERNVADRGELGAGLSIQREARTWLVRMDGDEPLSEEERRALREWMGRSAAHREELVRLARFWNQANRLAEFAVGLEPDTSTGWWPWWLGAWSRITGRLVGR
jgi:hypothetical protein